MGTVFFCMIRSVEKESLPVYVWSVMYNATSYMVHNLSLAEVGIKFKTPLNIVRRIDVSISVKVMPSRSFVDHQVIRVMTSRSPGADLTLHNHKHFID